MEQKKRKKSRRIGRQKKLILILDGMLLIGLVAALVWLSVSLSGRGGAGAPASAQANSGLTQPAPGTEDDHAAPPAKSAEQPHLDKLTVSSDGHPQSVDFSALTREGVPAVAWLYSAGTPISYPVVQTLDNEYYMERNELGKRDKNGAIFLDCRNTAEFVDAQIMLYGNPIERGSMFGSLMEYRNQSYFAEHPTLYLYTAQKNYRIDIFAAHTASPAMSNYPTWFENDSTRAMFINGVREKSLIESDMTIASDAKLVALVTCSDFDAGEDSRFVVHGVLAEI